MKKITKIAISLIITVLLSLAVCIPAFAVPLLSPINVTVSIIDAGTYKVTKKSISVGDENLDGDIDIDDALYKAHELYYTGGAAQGYASADGQYGRYIAKLWGNTTGAFGYDVNHKGAKSLDGKLAEGDVICAYIYTDQTTWSDIYTYFEPTSYTGVAGTPVTLTVKAIVIDPQNWQPKTVALDGITVMFNGKSYLTDTNGQVKVNADAAGTYLAQTMTNNTLTIVPDITEIALSAAPVTTTAPTRTNKNPKTQDSNTEISVIFAISILSIAGAAIVNEKRSKAE